MQTKKNDRLPPSPLLFWLSCLLGTAGGGVMYTEFPQHPAAATVVAVIAGAVVYIAGQMVRCVRAGNRGV